MSDGLSREFVMKLYILATIDILLLSVLSITSLHVLWIPKNDVDLLLAFVFGLCMATLGRSLQLIIEARDTRHLDSIQKIMLRLTKPFVLIVTMLGITLVFACLGMFILIAPLLQEYDLLHWCLDLSFGLMVSIIILFKCTNSKLFKWIFGE